MQNVVSLSPLLSALPLLSPLSLPSPFSLLSPLSLLFILSILFIYHSICSIPSILSIYLSFYSVYSIYSVYPIFFLSFYSIYLSVFILSIPSHHTFENLSRCEETEFILVQSVRFLRQSSKCSTYSSFARDVQYSMQYLLTYYCIIHLIVSRF